LLRRDLAAMKDPSDEERKYLDELAYWLEAEVGYVEDAEGRALCRARTAGTAGAGNPRVLPAAALRAGRNPYNT